MTLSAVANPASGALPACAAAMFVCGGAAGVDGAETPDVPLLGVSFAVAAIGVGFGGTLDFGARFGVNGTPLLSVVLLAKFSVMLSAMVNLVSGAPAVCAAVAIVCGGTAGTGDAEPPGVPWLEASFAVAAIGAGPGAGPLDAGARFGVKFGVRFGMRFGVKFGMKFGVRGASL